MFESLQGEKRLMPLKACYLRSRLPEKEQRVYDAMCRAVSLRQTEVTVDNVEGADADKIVHAVFFDQPLFYYLERKGMWTRSCGAQLTVGWEFGMGNEEIDRYDRRIVEKLAQLKLPKSGSLLQREIYIHDLMQKIGIRTGESDWTDHTIIGPLLLGHTVCEGMSKLFCMLCAICNIPCICVIGSGEPHGTKEDHAWNMVCIGGAYSHVDVYWDALLQVKEFNGYCYDYFNLSDRNVERDHTWDKTVYPACPQEKHSYFAFCRSDILSPDEYRELVRRCHEKGKRTITARMHYTYRADVCMQIIWEEYKDMPSVSCSRRVNKRQRVLEMRLNKK